MPELATLKKTKSTNKARLLQKNKTQSARVRKKLAALGGELRPIGPARNGARAAKLNPWDVHELSRDLCIDLKAAPTKFAGSAARGIAQALASCGFKTCVTSDQTSPLDGIHVETRVEHAAAALFIQGAFRTAGLAAGLTIHNRAATKRIVVYLGPQGLI